MNISKTILLVFCSLMISLTAFAQRTLPDIQVRTLEGQSVNITEHAKDGKITFITFWATWCVPCRRELDALTDIYDEWKEEFDLEVVAISIDDSRAVARVRPMVEQNGWPFTIYTDTNQELQKALNFQTIPQSFLLDKKGNIVYSHTGYVPGDEFELEEKIRALLK